MSALVVSNAQFSAHEGLDIYPASNQPHSVNHPSSVKQYKLLKSTTMASLMRTLAADLNVDEDLIRPWGLVGRQNGTLRPDSPLVDHEKTIEEAANMMQVRVPLRIWLEIATRNDEGRPNFYDYDTLMSAKDPTAPILLFLKHFDIREQTLKGQGHILVEKHRKISNLGPIILERMGWAPDVNVKLWEVSRVLSFVRRKIHIQLDKFPVVKAFANATQEIKSTMIESINSKTTFAAAELQHGDILCFQQVLPEEEYVQHTAVYSMAN